MQAPRPRADKELTAALNWVNCLVRDVGVPRLGLTRIGDVARTTAPLPVTPLDRSDVTFGIERSVKTLSSVAATVASFVATFGLCALSYHYFERPLIEFSHRRFRFAKSPIIEVVRAGQASVLGQDEATKS